jgi:aminoglycoside phosphotransferase (APT) family kinase protein
MPDRESPEEVPLTGGRFTEGVVRIGATVRRPTGAHSAFVHHVLRLLEANGVVSVPRLLGVDAQGREVLTYLPGVVPPTLGWRRWRDEQIVAAARIVRGIHDATAGSPVTAGSEVICHGDLSPCNFVFVDDVPRYVIDFDSAYPGSRRSDLAYMAWMWLIGGEDSREAPPLADRLRQLRLLLDAYGLPNRELFAESIQERQRAVKDSMASRGSPTWWVEGEMAFVADNAAAIDAAAHAGDRVEHEGEPGRSPAADPRPRGTPTSPAVDAELPLTGGNWTAGVVRVGDTVRRPRTRGSAFLARLLAHLEEVGYGAAPRYLGVDEQGRDILEFIPGVTTSDPRERDEAAYAAGGRMLRRLHDATAGHPLTGRRGCVIHRDPGPFNTIFRDGLPVAFIDWDGARPGAWMFDLAYLAWTWCIQSSGNVPIEDQARRLRDLRDGYGRGDAEALVRAIIHRQRFIARVAEMLAARPGHDQRYYAHQHRAIDWATADRRLTEQHFDMFVAALSGPRLAAWPSLPSC